MAERDELEELPESEELLAAFEGDDTVGGGGSEPDYSLTDDDVLTILQNDIEQAESYEDSESSDNRIEAYDYYMERPRGDEVEGRSRLVATDVADVVEWVMPEIMKAFNGPESVVRFNPEDDEDEEQAQQETEATFHVFYRTNPGFIILYTMVKCAILLRNAITKVYQDRSIKVKREVRNGINDEELRMYLEPRDGSEIYILEHESYQEEVPAPPAYRAQGVMTVTATFHNVVAKRISSAGRTKVENIPGDNFLYNRDHESIDLDEVRFCAQVRDTTEGALISEGWDPEMVRDLPSYTAEDEEGEAAARRSSGVISEAYMNHLEVDRANRPVRVYEAYKRLDVLGDGYPELYMVHIAGDSGGYKLMGYEPVEEIPFVGTTGIIMPHVFEGRSLFDRVKQIHDLKTTLIRNIVDNLYFRNNQRHEVVSGMVNLDDMLTNRPGGMVRVKAPGMVNPIQVTPVGAEAYRFLEYLDQERAGKSGVSPDDMRQNNRLPTDTAHGVERLMSAKEELVGLIIRVIAETGVAPMMRKIRNDLMKYQDSEMPVPISGKWTTVDPRLWKDTRTTRVNPGLSLGDRTRNLQSVVQVIRMQAEVAAGGGKDILVTHKHQHRALSDFVRFSQLGAPEDYWQDPESQEAQEAMQAQKQRMDEMTQRQQSFEEGLVRIQAQLEHQDQMLQYNKDMADLAFKYRELAEETANKMTELEAETGKDIPESRV